MNAHLHADGSPCSRLSRRRIISMAAVGAFGFAFTRLAQAAGQANALVLNCMDYRLVDDGVRYFNYRGLRNNYDQVILAGASIGALGKLGPEWAATFWKHVETAIALHKIERLIVMDHRDCGAYKIVFGDDSIVDKDTETALHRSQMIVLREQMASRFPQLKSEGLIMNLDGSVETLFPAEGLQANYKPAKPKPKPAAEAAATPAEPSATGNATGTPVASNDTVKAVSPAQSPAAPAPTGVNVPLESAAPPAPVAPPATPVAAAHSAAPVAPPMPAATGAPHGH